ncbi:MAG TPA: hypothetical protein VGF76_21710, partial [Polyangiaceae bacterium]
ASSSDAPPLNTLTHEATKVHPPRRNKPPDDFLVKLSAGTGGILSAPTIDVSNLGGPPPSSIEQLDIEPEELSTQRTGTGTAPLLEHGGTVPLFDMSAVLPAANPSTTLGSSSSAPVQIDIDVGPLRSKAPISAGKVRERKHVIAPQDAPPEHRSRRAGVLVWFGAVAVAAGVLAVVGLRGHRAPAPVASEPQPTAEQHSASLLSNAAPSVENTEAPVPVAEASSAAEVASAAPEVASAAPSIAPPNKAPVATTLATNAAVASSVTPKSEPSEPSEPPKAEAAIASEKPTTPAHVEIHNALPPAAPGTEFDRSAAVSALKGAAVQASSCRKDGDPSGTATLVITFAPSGRVTSATIQGPPFAGTPTGGCIANTMRHAQIPSFDGDRVTVTKTVVIE